MDQEIKKEEEVDSTFMVFMKWVYYAFVFILTSLLVKGSLDIWDNGNFWLGIFWLTISIFMGVACILSPGIEKELNDEIFGGPQSLS